MKLKMVKHGKQVAMIFDKHLVEKLKLTDRTEFDYRTDGTRLILYPQEAYEIVEA